MEKLEEKTNQEKTIIKDSLKTNEPLYKGLELIEEQVFMGKTSIKYWM